MRERTFTADAKLRCATSLSLALFLSYAVAETAWAAMPVGIQEGGQKAGMIRPASGADPANKENLAEVQGRLDATAKKEREKWREQTFEEFERFVFKERGKGGKYIVNGDTPILNRKHLREFYERTIAKEPTVRTELAVHTVDGRDAVWSSIAKRKITYCVSPDFGETRYAKVKADMEAAGRAWSSVADISFEHVPTEDSRCDAKNEKVVFDVRPVDVGGEYLARAFFPNEPRESRNVLIDASSFQLNPGDKLQLVGILRHELGHTLGLRHEHTRPESGACFEDKEWRPITSYDTFSVMHYPQCNGGSDWSLVLTAQDKSGIACVYGPAAGFQPDLTICQARPTVPPVGGTLTTKSFRNQRVAESQEKTYGPFRVRAGSTLEVRMNSRGTAPGDPDLYVRFYGSVDREAHRFDCRPFLEGADENCTLDVPDNSPIAHIMVYGHAAGAYNLAVKYVPARP